MLNFSVICSYGQLEQKAKKFIQKFMTRHFAIKLLKFKINKSFYLIKMTQIQFHKLNSKKKYLFECLRNYWQTICGRCIILNQDEVTSRLADRMRS